MDLLLTAVWTVAGAVFILLEILIYRRLRSGGADGGRERPAPAEPGGEALDRRPAPGSMDEGFENLMTYSVEGKNGFEALRGGDGA